MKAKLKRGMAVILVLVMILTMIPVQSRVSAADSEGQSNSITLEDGIYQVPVAECLQPGSAAWQGNRKTNEFWQADQYITVEAKAGEYTIRLSLYGGSKMDAVQVAKSGVYTEAKDFFAAMLDSTLLAGKVSEENIAALEAAGAAEAGAASKDAQVYDAVKKTGNHGMAEFTYTTDCLEETIRYMALSSLYNSGYNASSVVRVALKPDWDAAIKLSADSKEYSVIVMNTGDTSNAFDMEGGMDLKAAALFNKNVAVEEKDGSLQAKISLSGVSGSGYTVESVSRISEENELNSSNFTTLGSGTLMEEIACENGSFAVNFVDILTSVGIDIKLSGQKSVIHTRLRLVKGMPENLSVTKGKVALEARGNVLADASLEVNEYTQDHAPAYVNDDYVRNVISIAAKGNYQIFETNVKNSSDEVVETIKNATVSFKIPESWKPENVLVYRISEIATDTYTAKAASQVECYAKQGTAYATIQEYANDTFLVFERVQTQDITKLKDGIYDVTATLWNAATSSEAQSMAATVVKPEAALMIQGKKKYLKITFDQAGILFFPAYLSKAYARNVNMTSADLVTDQYHSGTIVEFWKEEEVKAFSKKLFMEYQGQTEEEADQAVATGMLQNNLKYVKTITFDVTNSIIKDGTHEGKIAIAFCCDIMDTLYNGIPGSDAGFNDAVLMLSDAVANSKLTQEDVLGVASGADKTKLTPLFEKAFTISRHRNNYTLNSYNAFVPAWSQTYAVYNSNESTQAEVDQAVESITAAMDNLISKKELNDILVKANRMSKANCEETTYNTFLTAKTEANTVYKNAAATQAEIAEQVRLLTEAREAVLPSETYLNTVRNAIDKAEATEQTTENGVYTNKSFKALQAAAAKASEVIATENVNYVAVEEVYTALTDAQKGLAVKGELTELEAAVNEALAKDLTPYLESTVTALEEAVDSAQALIKENDASQKEIEEALKALRDAIEGLKVLEDGTYIVPVTLWKANENAESMGNASLIQRAKVVVEDGEATLYFSFTKMKYAGKEGYLSDLSILTNITFDEYNRPSVYDKQSVEAVTVYDVVDEYNAESSPDENCAGKKYPKQMRLPVNLEENRIWAEVYVPVMGSVGSGTQLCRLCIDYQAAQEYVKPDMTALEASMQIAQQVKAESYTEESVRKLSNALEAAKEVWESEYSLQSDVDAAVLALDKAYKTLEAEVVETPDVPCETKKPDEGDTPGVTNVPAKTPDATDSPASTKAPADIPSPVPAATEKPAGTEKKNTTLKKSIQLAKKKLVIKKGKKATIKVKSKPAGKLKYKSANKKIATVSSKGVVKGKKKGTTKITVSCSGVKAVVKVTVKK